MGRSGDARAGCRGMWGWKGFCWPRPSLTQFATGATPWSRHQTCGRVLASAGTRTLHRVPTSRCDDHNHRPWCVDPSWTSALSTTCFIRGFFVYLVITVGCYRAGGSGERRIDPAEAGVLFLLLQDLEWETRPSNYELHV